MIRNRWSVLGATTLFAGLLTAAVTVPAAAAPATGPHCVSAAVPAGELVPADVDAHCFGTFAEAISYATKGAVRLPAGATRVTQRQLDVGPGTLGYQQPGIAAVVLGVSYKGTGWTGDTWIHTGSYGCDTNPDVDWQNTGPLSGPGGGWDNAISSALAYSDCTGRYWANSGFWGANIDTGWSGGVMNNATSSIQWY